MTHIPPENSKWPEKESLWGNATNFPWRSYTDAKIFVHTLTLHTEGEWKKYIQLELSGLPALPKDIPENPEQVYRHLGWRSWSDWLGIQPEQPVLNKQPETLWDLPGQETWMPHEEAKAFVHSLELEYKEEWEAYIGGIYSSRPVLPVNIPVNPATIYRHSGWKDWKDWLVAAEKQVEYSPFFATREFVRCLRLPDKIEWFESFESINRRGKKNGLTIPRKPDLEYSSRGWIDWADWFGLTVDYKSYDNTSRFTRSLQIRSREEWTLYCQGKLKGHGRKPQNIYAYPDIAYEADGWCGWEDWLGISG